MRSHFFPFDVGEKRGRGREKERERKKINRMVRGNWCCKGIEFLLWSFEHLNLPSLETKRSDNFFFIHTLFLIVLFCDTITFFFLRQVPFSPRLTSCFDNWLLTAVPDVAVAVAVAVVSLPYIFNRLILWYNFLFYFLRQVLFSLRLSSCFDYWLLLLLLLLLVVLVLLLVLLLFCVV